MNLLFVNSIPFNPILGGIERVTDILTKGLQKQGYHISYLCGYIDNQHEFMLNYDFPAPIYMLPESGLFDSEVNLAFYQELLERLDINIVINQRGVGGEFNRLLNVGNAKKISVLHSRPDAVVDSHIGRILLFPQFPKEFKEQLKKWIKFILYPIFYCKVKFMVIKTLKKKYQYLALNSDAIVLLSDKDSDVLYSYGIKENNGIICGIPNPNTFPVINDISVEEKDRIILFVGRLDQFSKNVLCLIKVWRRLFVKFPDWKLVIVGDGPEKNRIINYIRIKNIKNVYLEGIQKDVQKYYRKAAFICLTSIYEGWGMALTEGMAHGCIPFTFNNYGAAFDVVDDGINGCLIKAFDIKEYSIRLEELMSNDIKRIKMGKAALKKVEKFSVENVVKKWEDLFSRFV